MSDNLQKTFAEVRLRRLCKITLAAKYAPSVEGFIVDWSDSLLLMHAFDRDTFRLNGYCAIGLRFLKSFEHPTDDLNWMDHALRRKRCVPAAPKRLDLRNWATLIKSIDKEGRWFSMNLDGKRPREFFVSKLQSVRKTVVRLHDIGPDGDQRQPWSIKFADISRIRWADGYTKALESVA